MPKYTIIGIAGPAGAGKDTAGSMIQARTGGYTYAFARPVKRMLAVLGIDMDSEKWASKKDEVIPLLGVSPRYMMQTLGTEWGQHTINPQLWVLMAQVVFVQRGPLMIVTDVRFEHEAEWVRQMGGRIVHLTNRRRPNVEKHSSEDPLKIDNDDIVIDNSGSLEDLSTKIGELFGG